MKCTTSFAACDRRSSQQVVALVWVHARSAHVWTASALAGRPVAEHCSRTRSGYMAQHPACSRSHTTALPQTLHRYALPPFPTPA